MRGVTFLTCHARGAHISVRRARDTLRLCLLDEDLHPLPVVGVLIVQNVTHLAPIEHPL